MTITGRLLSRTTIVKRFQAKICGIFLFFYRTLFELELKKNILAYVLWENDSDSHISW